MSLLELAQSNNQPLADSSDNTGGLLGLATAPSTNPISKIDELQGQLQVAKANSDYANSMRGFGTNFLGGAIGAVKDVGQSVLDTFRNIGTQNAQTIQKSTDVWGNPESTAAQNIAAGLNLISPIANIAFSPLIAANAAAEKLPALKPAADLINNIFSIPGAIGKFGADKFVDNLPFVSQQTKDTLRPAFEDVGSLAGQIWLGGKIIETLGAKGDIKQEDINTLKEQAQTIPENAIPPKSPTPEVSQGLKGLVETPAEVSQPPKAEVAPKQEMQMPQTGYNIKEDKFFQYNNDTKQFDPVEKTKAVDIVPNLDTFAYKTDKGYWKIVEAKSGLSIPTGSNRTLSDAIENAKSMIKRQEEVSSYGVQDFVNRAIKDNGLSPRYEAKSINTIPTEQKIETPMENKISGVAKSIEAKAIEEKLTTEFPEKAEYRSSDFPKETQKVADLINSGIDNARAVVRGEKSADVKAGALIAGMELYAKSHPAEAYDIYKELANSHLASAISAGASETSFARMREANSPTDYLQKAQETKLGTKSQNMDNEISNAKTKISMATKKLMDYQKIIDQITTC